MANKCSPSHSLKFREASYDLLSDFLSNLNEKNKLRLCSLSKLSGNFKDKKLMGEYVAYLIQQRAKSIQQFSVCQIIWLTNVTLTFFLLNANNLSFQKHVFILLVAFYIYQMYILSIEI